MVKVSNAFPSKYLRAADLGGQKRLVKIERVEMEEIAEGEGDKMILYFEGKAKGLVMNKTNAGTLQSFISDDTDDWAGEEICLYPTKTDFQGKQVDAIRISVTKSDMNEARRNKTPDDDKPEAKSKKGKKQDDEIPF